MEKKSASRVWCEDFKKRRHLGDLGTCKKNTKMDLKEMGCEGVEQIFPGQDRNHYWALVNTDMIRGIQKRLEI